ncbi:sensor histidine kinase [Microbacterium sp. A93]|uniref:sensor histidine kinase n=1 Tax=Microbacterium sp. A93 TaxID=3450716 RepID=UPI003F4268EC
MPALVALILVPNENAWLGYVLVLATGMALWWRRSRPLLVLALVITFTSLSPLMQSGFGSSFIEGMVVLYAVASRMPLSRALLGYLMSVAIPFAASGLRILVGLEPILLNVLQPSLLVALLLGIAVRARREQRTALAELVNARIEAAALTERSRITAEMHDVVAHSITVMIALAGGAKAGWKKHPERAADALEQLGNVGANVLSEMQTILRILRDNDADLDHALHESGHNLPTLEELTDTFRSAGLPVTLTQSGLPLRENLPLQNTVYRIVQESLTNALRYARNPTAVTVEIAGDGEKLRITVTDDGQDAGRAESIGAGIGLTAMAERAAAFGGTHHAGPAPTGGWRTRATLPVPSPDSDGAES